MAQIATDPQGALFVHTHGSRFWDTFNEYTTAQTNAVIKPGVPGQSLYITDIFIQADASVTVSLIEGTDAVAARNLKFRTKPGAAADGVARSYKVPKKLKPGLPLTVTTSGAVTVQVEVHGFTAP